MPRTVDLEIVRSGDELQISARALAAPEGPMRVQVVRYTPLRTTEITRGENSGKTLDYANVVDDWREVAIWDGATPLSLQARVTGEKPVVVLIQQGVGGPILAAERLR